MKVGKAAGLDVAGMRCLRSEDMGVVRAWLECIMCVGPLQISFFFMTNNPQVNLYKYNLGSLYNYCTTGLNLYKYDLAAGPLQVQSLENFLPGIAYHNQAFITSTFSLLILL